jgi:zinc transport system substrate-binding protein
VRSDDVPAPACDPLDRGLQRRVLERLDLPAVVAHEVMVMVAVRVSWLETRDPVAEVDALHEPELVHPVESAVHACDADIDTGLASELVDLAGRKTAVLAAEQLDHDAPRASTSPARLAQPRQCSVRPSHSDNDTHSQHVLRWPPVRACSLLCVLVIVAAGCSGSDKEVAPAPRDVVASIYPLAWATERVEAAVFDDVVNLTPPGVEPHDVELSPRDVETIRDAELVVFVGGGFQPALEDAVESRDGRSLDLRDADEDPHIWLDPVRFAQAVEHIAEAVGGAGSVHDEIAELKRLDAQYRRGLADCERRVLATTHAAFGHLATRYGLTELSLAGRSPEAEPSPRELEKLIDDVRASGATTVFAEPLVSDEVAATVAREAGARLATLDPIEGLSQERLDAGEDYLTVMRSNLEALREALGCR